jgi:hypothetical protein
MLLIISMPAFRLFSPLRFRQLCFRVFFQFSATSDIAAAAISRFHY